MGDVELRRDSTLTLVAALPPGATPPVTIAWSEDLGGLIVRQGGGEGGYAVQLTGGAQTEPLPRSGVAEQSMGDVVARYVLSGFDHIIPQGLDHILFVLGLFFYSFAWRPLLWQVTAFTAAHTATLALATLGYVTLPPEIVEPLIAASIVWIAVENILTRHRPARIGWTRIAVVFGFGLLHGLGFASVLQEFGLAGGAELVASLVAFNVGVELGQLAVIAFAALLVGLPFGHQRWYREAIAFPASGLIGAVGLWWVLERTVLSL